jgi:membrane protein YqaA with SNARE-associated domain
MGSTTALGRAAPLSPVALGSPRRIATLPGPEAAAKPLTATGRRMPRGEEGGRLLTRLYDWTIELAAHRRAPWALAAVSFAESSLFPVPPDVLLIPMVLAARRRAWTIAGLCTIASVGGGVAGYLIGYFLFDTLGRPIVEFYGYVDEFATFQGWYRDWGAWIVAGAGFTPFPYKVITIASGAVALDPITFMVASASSRGARFFLVAGLLWYFGPAIRRFIEANLPLVASAFFVLLFGGFVAARWLL